MPSGIAFTIWVTQNYKANNRDDMAFYETAKAIRDSFGYTPSCINPCTPGDDFLENLDSNQKNNFIEAFNTLIADSEKALRQDSLIKACNIWRQQFGNRFPELKSS